jgi:hypothetical protein
VNRQLLSSDPALALTAAQYLVNRYKDPPPRIPTVTIDLANVASLVPAQMPTLLGLANSQRVTWKRNATTPINSDGYVEQIQHTINPGVNWQMTVQLSPASLEMIWVLGDADRGKLGETTALSY